ncbi:DUF2141 domain-containing protein [soil metagenome]
MTIRPAALLFALSLIGAGAAHAADLTLTFTGIKTPTGAVMAAVFDSEAAYASGAAPIAGLRMAVTGAGVSQVVPGLKPGRYAIKAFHDVDGDGKMKTNPFGIPTEPYAFSNNAPASMAPPAWSAAAFDLPETGAAQSIRID